MRGSQVVPFAPRFRVRRAPRRVAVALLGLAALLMPLAQGAARAEEEGGAIPLGDFRLLEPIERSLGASSWMAASGYDPRLWDVPTGGEARGVDWGAYAGPQAAPPRAGAYQPLVPFRSAAPAFSRNQIVTRQIGLFPLQTEPHVAVNPFDPEHLVLGTIDYNFPSMSSYVSFDGGETWDGPNQVRYFQEDFSAAGDPVVAFDRDGTVYMTSISLGFEEFRLGSLVSATEVSSMIVSKSEDDGLTWSDPVSTARSTVQTTSQPDPEGRERGTLTSQFLDKPWMAVGPDPENPDNDIIYLTYTEFATTYSVLYADELPFLTSPVTETTIRMIRSEDAGATWTEPVAVSPTVLQAEGASEPGEGEGEGRAAAAAQDDDGEGGQTQQEAEGPGPEANQTVQGSQPAVLPDGTLVMTYLDTTNDGVQEGLSTIMVRTSSDGGRTLSSEPVQAGVFRELHFTPRNSTFRYWGAAFPQIAVGPGEEVYIATAARPADKPTDDGDIFLMRSADKGQTWQPPVRVNQDDTDRVQFFPSIDVSEDGVLHAMWGDMRDDPEEARYHIYYTRSDDRGETFGFEAPEVGLNVPDTRVTDFPSNSLRGFPGGRFIGDYFSLAANEDDVYMVWADTRLGEFGGPNQQIGFARQTQIAPPELFLNPDSGPAGRDVAIQGFAFQPNSNIAIDVGGVPITNVRSDENGEFTTNVYMPVTGEGPRNVRAFDETGNVATIAFFTEVGFDSLAREIGELRDQLGPAQQAGAGPS
ncbi:MAG: glycoside hydrolase, partial [Chloroflexota bacterium]|nr:glycoside hydrolase [Chloroflexota bacterium]